MAISHVTAVRNSLAGVISAAVDAGTTNAAGAIVIMTAADATLATLPMANPSFGAAAGGSITANTIAASTASAAGTAALFKIVSRDAVEVYRGTVGTTGTDMILTSTTFAVNDGVEITSLVYTASV